MATVAITRGRVGVAVGAVLLVAWLVWITVSIAREPLPGEPTLGELSAHTQDALVTHDADALALLLDYPQKDAPDFAQRYLDALGPDTDAVTVTPDAGRGLLTVGGHRRTGPAFSYPVRAIQDPDGRWVVSFLPPV